MGGIGVQDGFGFRQGGGGAGVRESDGYRARGCHQRSEGRGSRGWGNFGVPRSNAGPSGRLILQESCLEWVSFLCRVLGEHCYCCWRLCAGCGTSDMTSSCCRLGGASWLWLCLLDADHADFGIHLRVQEVVRLLTRYCPDDPV